MSSEKAVGAAPLVTGIVLASQSAREVITGGLSPWSVAGLVGGCAAVAVGAGILLEWGEFDARANEPGRTAALAGLALLSFAVGAGLAVV